MPTPRHLSLLALALLLGACAGSRPDEAVPAGPPALPEAATTSPAPEVEPLPPMPGFQQAIEAGTRTEVGRPGPSYWQQEVDYAMTARLLPDANRLEGTARITYTNNAPAALPVLALELAQNVHGLGAPRLEPVEVTGGVQLERVAVGGAELSETSGDRPGYVVEGTLMGLLLPTPLAQGAQTEIEIAWSFTIPQAGAGERMGYSDDLFFLAYWYPQMRVYDDVSGWMIDPFLNNAEFYADHGNYEVTIEAPEGWLIWATGELQNPTEVLPEDLLTALDAATSSDAPVMIAEPGDALTGAPEDSLLGWRFTANNVRDFAFSAVQNHYWEAARAPVGDRDGDGDADMTHIHTFWRASAPLWAEVTRYQQHAISFLSAYTGFPYPYPHMTAVEGGGIIQGGMEFPMMTLMGDYNARGDSALYNVTAHELAHMWIPMIVSTNERRYSWIDEGSTSFAENEARLDYFPGPVHRLGDQETYLQVARYGLEGEMMRRSDFHYPGPGFGVASYSKPATVLEALRGVIGEETFQEAYRSFIADWAYKHPYPQDFFNTFERVSGQDLTWFWRAWYYGVGTLDQAIAAVETAPEGTVVTVANEGEVPMPVLLRATYPGGETAEETIPVDVWLGGEDEASVTLPAGAERVEIDPDAVFPDIDRADNVWTP